MLCWRQNKEEQRGEERRRRRLRNDTTKTTTLFQPMTTPIKDTTASTSPYSRKRNKSVSAIRGQAVSGKPKKDKSNPKASEPTDNIPLNNNQIMNMNTNDAESTSSSILLSCSPPAASSGMRSLCGFLYLYFVFLCIIVIFLGCYHFVVIGLSSLSFHFVLRCNLFIRCDHSFK